MEIKIIISYSIALLIFSVVIPAIVTQMVILVNRIKEIERKRTEDFIKWLNA
jgi:hypothetical protein